MKKTEQTVTVLEVLKSKGFEPVVTAIREGLPNLAEASLMDLEAEYGVTFGDYTTEENIAIEAGIEECWRRIERLRKESEGLK